ncbi:MAG: type III secretion system translocon subunit SctE, partial [Parachlamydia sp.]|nr:type III secretion system translocon subunit SctE [Parachlamydia sp.]
MQPDISNNQFSTPGMSLPQGWETQGTEQIQTPAGVILGDNDSIAVFDALFTGLQFSTPKTYEKDAQHPGLPPPSDEVPAISPYGTAQQKIVKEFFSTQVAAFIQEHTELPPEDAKAIFESILTGTPLANPKLAKLAGQISEAATQKTIENSSLPASWTLQSTSPRDWTPVPMQPYGEEKQQEINQSYDDALMGKIEQHIQNNNLDPEQAAQLRTAAQTGKVTPSIADAYIALNDETRAEIQASFGLSVTWFRGTVTPSSWTPVNLSAVNPTAVSKARVETLLANMEQIATDVQAAAEQLVASLPADGGANIAQSKVALSDFLKIIGDAIRDLKSTLRELQLVDAESSKKNTKTKFSQLEDKRLRMEEESKKLEKQLEKQLQMKSMGLSMQVVGPLISAFMTIMGTLLAILSLGTATAASVAMIAAGAMIGTMMTAYSIADSVHGLTQKGMEAMTKAIAEAMPNAPDWVKSLVKALIIAAVVAILAVAMVASGGSAGSIAASVGTQVAKENVVATVKMAVFESIKQLSMQAIILMIMSSNVVPELTGNVLKELGVDKDTVTAMQMVMMAATMMVCVFAMSKVANSGLFAPAKGAEDAAETGATAAKTSTSTADKFKDAFADFTTKAGRMKAEMGEQAEAIKQSCVDLRDYVMGLPNLAQAAKQACIDVIDSISQFPEKMAGFADEIAKMPESMLQSLNKFKNMTPDEKMETMLPDLMMVTNIVPLVPSIVGGAVQGTMSLRVSELIKDQGDLKSAIELLEGLIKALEGLLRNLQTGMSTRDDFVLQLQQFFTS